MSTTTPVSTLALRLLRAIHAGQTLRHVTGHRPPVSPVHACLTASRAQIRAQDRSARPGQSRLMAPSDPLGRRLRQMSFGWRRNWWAGTGQADLGNDGYGEANLGGKETAPVYRHRHRTRSGARPALPRPQIVATMVLAVPVWLRRSHPTRSRHNHQLAWDGKSGHRYLLSWRAIDLSTRRCCGEPCAAAPVCPHRSCHDESGEVRAQTADPVRQDADNVSGML